MGYKVNGVFKHLISIICFYAQLFCTWWSTMEPFSIYLLLKSSLAVNKQVNITYQEKLMAHGNTAGRVITCK